MRAGEEEVSLPIEDVEVAADVIHCGWGTGTGEDGYYRVFISQHAEAMARAALQAVRLTDPPAGEE